jgi:hypothetical protein
MPPNERAKDPAAVALGRRGGLARAKTMSARQRSEASRYAVSVRWAKTRRAKQRTEDKEP